MKDRNTIYLDYKKAIGLAEDLESAAKKLRKQMRKIDSARKSLRKNWTGDNATLFISKMEKLEENLDGIALQLDRSADTIRDNAKTIYDADLKAITIAEMASSKHVISR